MRWKTLVVTLTVICLAQTLCPAAAASETTVAVTAPATVHVGASFTVNVTVTPDEALGGMECGIRFNASVLEAKQVEAGGLFEEWVNSSLTVDNDSGSVSQLLGFNYEGNETTEPGTFAAVTFTATGEGQGWIRLVNVTLSDPTGIESVSHDISNDTVVVVDDDTPPGIGYELKPATPDGDSGWYDSPVEVSMTARDKHGVKNVSYRIGDGGWHTVSANATTFSVSTGGNHTVQLKATDAAGNTNTTAFTLKVDDVSPRSSCTVPGGTWQSNASIAVDWQASDNVALWGVTVWYRPASGSGSWQAASFAEATGSDDSGTLHVDVAELDGEGVYAFASSASDRAGNSEEKPMEADCEAGYDSTPPTANATLTGTEIDDGVYQGSVAVTLTAADELSGVHRIEYNLDGGGWQPYEGDLSVAEKGNHTVLYRAVDVAGNTGWAKAVSFEIRRIDLDADFTYAKQQDGRTVSFTDRSRGDIDRWHWSFGDGGESSARHPEHMFSDSGTYHVTLTVSNENGPSDSVTRAISLPALKPEAAFSYSPTTADAGESISFTSRSSDPDGSIASVSWSFDDGSSATGGQAEHSYEHPGNYTVTLTVTDDAGNTDSVQRVVSVNDPPTAAFDAPDTGVVGVPVNVTDRSTDSDGRIVTWTWRFGDGNRSHRRNASHSYSEAGTYTVTLQVEDSHNATDSVSRAVTINPRYELRITDLEHHASLFGTGTVTLSIENTGGQTAGKVACTLFIDGDAVETKQAGEVPAGGTTALSFAVDVSPLSGHTIRGVVDPDDEFREGNENNNDIRIDVPISWLPVAVIAAVVAAAAGVAVFMYRRRQRKPTEMPRRREVQVQDGRQVQRCFVCRGKLKADAAAVQCECGNIFHRSCAKRVGECPDCGRALDASPDEDAADSADE